MQPCAGVVETHCALACQEGPVAPSCQKQRIEAPNLSANLAWSGWAVIQSDNASEPYLIVGAHAGGEAVALAREADVAGQRGRGPAAGLREPAAVSAAGGGRLNPFVRFQTQTDVVAGGGAPGSARLRRRAAAPGRSSRAVRAAAAGGEFEQVEEPEAEEEPEEADEPEAEAAEAEEERPTQPGCSG